MCFEKKAPHPHYRQNSCKQYSVCGCSCCVAMMDVVEMSCPKIYLRGIILYVKSMANEKEGSWESRWSFEPISQPPNSSLHVRNLFISPEGNYWGNVLSPHLAKFINMSECFLCKAFDFFQPTKKTKIPWPESVSELYRPSDRRLSAKLLPTFSCRGCHEVSMPDPYGRILGFLDRSCYFVFQVAPQLYSRGWVDPVPDPLLLRKSPDYTAALYSGREGSSARELNNELFCVRC
jgi:hypothetical protein